MNDAVKNILEILQELTVKDAIQLQEKLHLSDSEVMDMVRRASGIIVDPDSAPFWWLSTTNDPNVPVKKIQAIKVVREVMNLPLKEAKNIVDGNDALEVSRIGYKATLRLRSDLESFGMVITPSESKLPF